jgi:hypothetical protein
MTSISFTVSTRGRSRIVESRFRCAVISVLGCTLFQSARVGIPLPSAAQFGRPYDCQARPGARPQMQLSAKIGQLSGENTPEKRVLFCPGMMESTRPKDDQRDRNASNRQMDADHKSSYHTQFGCDLLISCIHSCFVIAGHRDSTQSRIN